MKRGGEISAQGLISRLSRVSSQWWCRGKLYQPHFPRLAQEQKGSNLSWASKVERKERDKTQKEEGLIFLSFSRPNSILSLLLQTLWEPRKYFVGASEFSSHSRRAFFRGKKSCCREEPSHNKKGDKKYFLLPLRHNSTALANWQLRICSAGLFYSFSFALPSSFAP